VNSQAVREQLITRDRVAKRKLRIVYNAVDVERFMGVQRRKNRLLPTIAERSRVVAVLANMYSPVKGHDCLISAARIVCEDEPDVVFLLIGDGPERPRLEAQARAAGLEGSVVFIGQRTDVPELLACCDLSVLPSENEAFPNAILESMSAGLPVVATAVGGSKEIIQDEVNGLLVPPRRPEALATALLRLLRDSRLAKRMAHAGQEDVRTRFSFDRLMAELDHLYREPLES
jgi:L-malate glycosyltransferase